MRRLSEMAIRVDISGCGGRVGKAGKATSADDCHRAWPAWAARHSRAGGRPPSPHAPGSCRSGDEPGSTHMCNHDSRSCIGIRRVAHGGVLEGAGGWTSNRMSMPPAAKRTLYRKASRFAASVSPSPLSRFWRPLGLFARTGWERPLLPARGPAPRAPRLHTSNR